MKGYTVCLSPSPLKVSVLVMCHTRELAFQISKEYERFSKYMPNVKVSQGRALEGCGCGEFRALENCKSAVFMSHRW